LVYLGQYTLFAAKLGRNVVSVEPFYDNIIRIHKAARLENLQSKIVLITNALSNSRGDIKLLMKTKDNIGGQGLNKNENIKYTKSDLATNKYLVETIIFDDIIEYLPKMDNKMPYKKAIMKIDIEGFEPYALANATQLFKLIDIRVIFMEWLNMPSIDRDSVIGMMNLLKSLNFMPFKIASSIPLNESEWLKWPGDIVWLKN
jgi:FkbM family methyltransferase